MNKMGNKKKKGSCVMKRRRKFIAQLFPKLQKMVKVKSEKEMHKLLDTFQDAEMFFIAECAYNVIFNGEKLLTKDQIAFLKSVFKKCKREHFDCLYKFTFQKLTKGNKVRCLCQSYYLFSVIVSMLIPIFKILIN